MWFDVLLVTSAFYLGYRLGFIAGFLFKDETEPANPQ